MGVRTQKELQETNESVNLRRLHPSRGKLGREVKLEYICAPEISVHHKLDSVLTLNEINRLIFTFEGYLPFLKCIPKQSLT